jgi:chromosome segregation ATPase
MHTHSSYRVAAAIALAVVLLGVESAQAQTARSGGNNANAQLLMQMQQLASERTSLQAENAKLKKDLEDMRKERDTLKNGQAALVNRVKASEANLLKESAARNQASSQELTQTKEKMQELVAKFRETLQNMRQIEAETTTTKQTLATRDQELKTCIDRNMALYKLNDEVLTRLEHQGGLSRVARAEPFTQIKRVQLENLVDEYKSRADDQRATPDNLRGSGPPPPPAPPPPAPPASSH